MYEDPECTKVAQRKFSKLRLGSQRFQWQYIANPLIYTCDNGVTYDQGEYKRLIQEKIAFKESVTLPAEEEAAPEQK